ncbi:MAG: class I SAM-dependent methyltransferase [Rhodocyclaceae bacterium]|nr:class I SAM-dependent methyltransferase [Rhodocyclaceae bacterium]
MADTGFIDWLESEQGRYVRHWVETRHDQLVADIFGFNAVQVGLPQLDLLRANRMPFRFYCADEGAVQVRASALELPFATASIDLVVLPHVLEFSDNPHQVLREVERVLMPEGSVLITGFNPFSLWGSRRRLARRPAPAPWRGRYISVPRLKDWCKLLNLETHMGCFGCYAPPLQQEKWLNRWRFMEPAGDRWWPFAGGVYMLQAVKRIEGMRLIMPSWKDIRAAKAMAPVVQRHGKVQRNVETMDKVLNDVV